MNRFVKYIIVFWVGFGIAFSQLTAQSIDARMRADSTQLLIGDHLHVEIEVEYSPQIAVKWPLFTDTLGGFEIINRSQMDTAGTAESIIQRQTLTLIAFDSGNYRIPEVSIPYLEAGAGEPRKVETNPLLISVYTVPVDTTQAFKPIKDVLDSPITFREMLPYIGLGVVLLAIIGGLIWYFRKRKSAPIEIIEKPKIKVPPHETAMRKLAQLEQEKLWQKDEIKLYYIGLTEILREYIEGKFEIPALESITDEIIRDLESVSLSDKQIRTLQDLLQMADLAKFAKFKPDMQANMSSMDTVRTFVKETKDWKKYVEEVPEMENEPEVEQEIEAEKNTEQV